MSTECGADGESQVLLSYQTRSKGLEFSVLYKDTSILYMSRSDPVVDYQLSSQQFPPHNTTE